MTSRRGTLLALISRHIVGIVRVVHKLFGSNIDARLSQRSFFMVVQPVFSWSIGCENFFDGSTALTIAKG